MTSKCPQLIGHQLANYYEFVATKRIFVKEKIKHTGIYDTQLVTKKFMLKYYIIVKLYAGMQNLYHALI